jgi:hypothetical protein
VTNTNWRGPANSLGAMEDSTVGEDDGPNYAYQGTLFPNLRGGVFNKDGVGAGRVPGFLDNPQFVSVDNIPSAASTTILAAAAAVVTGTAMTLSTTAPGNTVAGTPSVASGVPIIPFGSSTVTTAPIALDFGFTTGTTTAASSTVVVVDNTLFTLGQWLCIGGAGNAGKTAALLTQVASISTANTTTITISPVALGTLTNAPISGANLFNQGLPPATQFGPSAPAATAEANALAGGMFRIFNAVGALSRNISITATTTGAAGGAFLVTGWDVHNQVMTEKITVAASTTTSYYGKKAFKYINAITPQFTDATTATYSVGVGDVFGLPIRQDRGEYVDWSWNGIFKTNNTGFTGAVLTTATNTTGDVRGTVQVSALGGGTGVGSTPSNNTSRLFFVQTMPLWNTLAGTPNTTAPFFGVTQG